MRGRSILVKAFEILFPSHLMRCDDVACVVATCQVLVGLTWTHPSTRPLVFLRFNFSFGGVYKLFVPLSSSLCYFLDISFCKSLLL